MSHCFTYKKIKYITQKSLRKVETNSCVSKHEREKNLSAPNSGSCLHTSLESCTSDYTGVRVWNL